MNRIWLFFLCLCVASTSALLGCGNDTYNANYLQGGSSSTERAGASSTGGRVAGTTFCIAGADEICVTSDGRKGFKFCSEDGSHFSDCYSSEVPGSSVSSTGGVSSVIVTNIRATGGSSVYVSPATGGAAVYLSSATGGRSVQVVSPTGGAQNTACTDCDGDGEYATTDCNDLNSSIHHGAYDVCGDGIDQDCSGADAVCNSTSSGSYACANMSGITGWKTLTLVVTTNETSRVQFSGMCDNGTIWSTFTVIPGCENVTSSGSIFTCTTQIPIGWTFEGNNNLNNGYWSVGVLTGDAARNVCPSSFNSSKNTCSDIWSARSAHGSYTINGITCQMSTNWVENDDGSSFNCRVTP